MTFEERSWDTGVCVVVYFSVRILVPVVVLDLDGTFDGGGLSLVDEVEFFCCGGPADEVEVFVLDLVFGLFAGFFIANV